ncbi:Universal stress protein A homolog 2 [Crenothrix polyspora]|uniref:Universal stress protein n=1 Tax=Crenothrix polyspora TaxID=360316 RepID=A0A1R4H095_9GAMM|nr:universal stress protein [Crenothrix polyspora]SJM89249.1 Universal stress protein A homolog 2 [Crenothrix polyspora]
MQNYQHILLAVDFFEQSELVIERAKNLASIYQSTLSIIHVVDSLPVTDTSYGATVPFDMDLTSVLMENAKKRLSQLAKELGLVEQNTYLEIGSPKSEIIRIAEDIKADLIIVGSHGRHGLALLLGSTANGVLHHAICDVLAVRLSDD